MSNDSKSGPPPAAVGSMNLRSALALADRGYSVFPCRPGAKIPATEHGVHDATIDGGQIRLWFGNDRNFNLGVAMGPLPCSGSNVVAIDVDRKGGGLETWDKLITDYTLPSAPTHRTPNGGLHVFFETGAVDLRNTSKKLGPGIDTRAHGGYVVAPRSRLIDFETGEIIGHYSAERGMSLMEMDLPPIPEWMLALLLAEPEKAPRPSMTRSPTAPAVSDSVADLARSGWSWPDELEADGWTLARRGRGDTEWTRPGKSVREGTSATLHNDGDGPLVVWSSSVPDGGKPTRYGNGLSYSPWDYLVTFRHGGDARSAARQVRERCERPTTHSSLPAGEAQEPSEAILGPEWWQRRSWLAQVHQAAKAEMVNPEALLLHTLCRASAMIPPCYRLPGVGGGPAGSGTLDLMGCVIGETGAGKTMSAKVGRSFVADPAKGVPWSERAVLLDVPVGSGEGLIDAYYENVLEENADGKRVPVRKIVHKGVFMVCDEGNAFISVQGRKGVTIVETMNSAWSGETLGQANANAERFRLIEAGTVRFAAVLNMQASNAHKLFDEGLTVVGFPGRLLFAPASDPEAALDGPEWPGSLQMPAWVSYGNEQYLTYDPAISREIKERILAQVRGEHDARRSQNIVGQCKVAGIFAMLDERTNVSLDDWALAADVLARSSMFLGRLEAQRSAWVRDERHKRSEMNGEMEVVAESAKERAYIGRAADRILLVLGEGPMAPSSLSAKLTTRQREFRDAAVEHLRQMGKVAQDPDGRWALTP